LDHGEEDADEKASDLLHWAKIEVVGLVVAR